MEFTQKEISQAIQEVENTITANRVMILRALTEEDENWSRNRIEKLKLKLVELKRMLKE